MMVLNLQEQNYAKIFVCAFLALFMHVTGGFCSGSMVSIWCGPSFIDFYPNGEAFSISADFARMRPHDTRGFTISTSIHSFWDTQDDKSSITNERLFVVGPGYMIRNSGNEDSMIFLHPAVGVGFLTRSQDYFSPTLNQRYFSKETDKMLILSVGIGWRHSIKDNLELSLRVKPLVVFDFIDGAAGIEFSGGLNYYF